MKFPGLGFIANLKRRAEEREVLNFYGRKVFLSSKRFLKKEKKLNLMEFMNFAFPSFREIVRRYLSHFRPFQFVLFNSILAA